MRSTVCVHGSLLYHVRVSVCIVYVYDNKSRQSGQTREGREDDISFHAVTYVMLVVGGVAAAGLRPLLL